jgi:hypothetical protein
VAATQSSISFSPGFEQLLNKLLDNQIRQVSRILAESQLRPCEYEDELHPLGCGRTASVGSLEYESELCERHFRAVSRG